MIRLRGDRSSLLAALLAHWSEEQLALPSTTHPWLPLNGMACRRKPNPAQNGNSHVQGTQLP
jgi:hypothetical protein